MISVALTGALVGALIGAVIGVPIAVAVAVRNRRAAAARRSILAMHPTAVVVTMSIESTSSHTRRWLRQLVVPDTERLGVLVHFAVSASEVLMFAHWSEASCARFRGDEIDDVAVTTWRRGVRRFPAVRMVVRGRELVMLSAEEARFNGLRNASKREVESTVAALRRVLAKDAP